MIMPRLRRLLICATVGLVCVGLAAFVFEEFRRGEERQRLEIPREWARLAPYPASARGLRATTSGTMFTRSFRVYFSAPAADIERWLRDSPGTREAAPDRPSPGKRHFDIAPGGGAQHAEIMVDDAAGTVSIYVYWS